MNCPYCSSRPSGVLQTLRPVDEGLDEGEVKKRRRKCRNCSRDFFTYEIQEALFRSLTLTEKRLTRRPLAGSKQLAESRRKS